MRLPAAPHPFHVPPAQRAHRLTDPDWLPFDDNPSAYNFFRLTVEMK